MRKEKRNYVEPREMMFVSTEALVGEMSMSLLQCADMNGFSFSTIPSCEQMGIEVSLLTSCINRIDEEYGDSDDPVMNERIRSMVDLISELEMAWKKEDEDLRREAGVNWNELNELLRNFGIKAIEPKKMLRYPFVESYSLFYEAMGDDQTDQNEDTGKVKEPVQNFGKESGKNTQKKANQGSQRFSLLPCYQDLKMEYTYSTCEDEKRIWGIFGNRIVLDKFLFKDVVEYLDGCQLSLRIKYFDTAVTGRQVFAALYFTTNYKGWSIESPVLDVVEIECLDPRTEKVETSYWRGSLLPSVVEKAYKPIVPDVKTRRKKDKSGSSDQLPEQTNTALNDTV